MISLTVENYLKEILLLDPSRREPIPTGKIARALKVAPGTVTAMLKTLEEAGLVRYRRYGGVQLTKEGEALALHVLRRHRLVEQFLVKVLRMSWTEVHEEAEALEHAVSEKVLARMDAILGHPTVDPHGDPIPQANGVLPPVPKASLDEAAPGKPLVVVRLVDQRPEFLKLADRIGLVPGKEVLIEKRDDAAQTLSLRTSSGREALSIPAAENVLVRPAGASPAGEDGSAKDRRASQPALAGDAKPARKRSRKSKGGR